MEDHIQGRQIRQRIGCVVGDQLEPRGFGQVGDVLPPPGAEIVDAYDRRSGHRAARRTNEIPRTRRRQVRRLGQIPCRTHVPDTPSAERCAHCVVRAQAPGGLLVHSCGIRGNPIPGVAAADPLEAGPRELSTAAR
jgi:hypothetical protein